MVSCVARNPSRRYVVCCNRDAEDLTDNREPDDPTGTMVQSEYIESIGHGSPISLPRCLVASLPRCLVALLPCCLVALLPCCLVASSVLHGQKI